MFYANIIVEYCFCITFYANFIVAWRNVCIFAGKQVALGNQANVAFVCNLLRLTDKKTYKQ